MLKFADRLLSVFFPKRCKYCGELIVPEKDICENCESSMPRILPPYCPFAVTAKRTAPASRQKANIPPSPLRFTMRAPPKPPYTA